VFLFDVPAPSFGSAACVCAGLPRGAVAFEGWRRSNPGGVVALRGPF